MSTNAVWTYEAPYAAANIKDYLAFYPDRVEVIEEHPRGLSATRLIIPCELVLIETMNFLRM